MLIPRLTKIGLILAAGLLIACDAGDEPTTSTPDIAVDETARRANGGKADFIPKGSCEDACGKKTKKGNCYCDEVCEKYGDCCLDKVEICDAGGCTSDDECAAGEYCAQVQCITTPCPALCTPQQEEGTPCNLNVQCQEGLLCLDGVCAPAPPKCKRTGCSGQVCAFEDVITTCEYKPEYACYDEPGASCGLLDDGTCGWTLSGEAQQCMDKHTCGLIMCTLWCEHGFQVDDNGCEICACKPAPEEGCNTDADCGEGQFCQDIVCITTPCNKPCVDKAGEGGDCGADNECKDGLSCVEGVCSAACNPVMCELFCENGFKVDENGCEICECNKPACFTTGCSGQICSDKDVITTCEFKPEYACYKAEGATCEKQANGACGWTIEGQAAQCFEDFAEPKSACEGFCGGKSPEGCWCDQWCAAYGDCCPDKKATCN